MHMAPQLAIVCWVDATPKKAFDSMHKIRDCLGTIKIQCEASKRQGREDSGVEILGSSCYWGV